MNPLVSVIVPNYNHSAYLKERLESVYGQSFQDFEVLLLDDKSTDNSAEILEEYRSNPKTAQLIINDTNTGSPFAQWRKGAQLAKGEFVWIAESDDSCSPLLLDELVTTIHHQKDIAIAYCQSQDIDPDGNFRFNWIKHTEEFAPNIWVDNFCIDSEEFIKSYLQFRNVIPNASAVLVRRTLLIEALESMPELGTFKACGDWLVWLHVCAHQKMKVSFCSKPLNNFRRSPGSTRIKWNIPFAKKLAEEEIAVRFRYASRFSFDPTVQQPIIKALTKKYFGLVSWKEGPKGFEGLSNVSSKSTFALYANLLWSKLIKQN